MGYYQGDYMQGGFLSFLGGLAKKAVGFIPGVGPVASAGIGMAQRGLKLVRGGAGVAMRGVKAHPVLSAAGAAGALMAGEAMVQHPGGVRGALPAGGMMRGMHISRKTGAMVKNRHMRVTNPRALRRALRRAHGFAKLAMRTIHLVHPRKKGRFGGFRKHKKK
jgi:hypothetical protein